MRESLKLFWAWRLPMKNSFLWKVLSLAVYFGASTIASNAYGDEVPLEPGYTAYDKHKAVITCMQYSYAQQGNDRPADATMFPTCEQRFLDLSRQLSHEQFVEQRAAQNPHQEHHTFNTYYDVLFGIPPKTEISDDKGANQ